MQWDYLLSDGTTVTEEFPAGFSHEEVKRAAQNRYGDSVLSVCPSPTRASESEGSGFNFFASDSADDSGCASALALPFVVAGISWHFLPWAGIVGGGFFALQLTERLTRDKMSKNKRLSLALIMVVLSSFLCFEGSRRLHKAAGYNPQEINETVLGIFRNN